MITHTICINSVEEEYGVMCSMNSRKRILHP